MVLKSKYIRLSPKAQIFVQIACMPGGVTAPVADENRSRFVHGIRWPTNQNNFSGQLEQKQSIIWDSQGSMKAARQI